MPYPAITRTDPADQSTDACSDAAKIIADSMLANQENGVACGSECLEVAFDDLVMFELPRIFVTVKQGKYPNQMAQWALEQVALQLLAASRQAAVTK
jgi:hypothetical protein